MIRPYTPRAGSTVQVDRVVDHHAGDRLLRGVASTCVDAVQDVLAALVADVVAEDLAAPGDEGDGCREEKLSGAALGGPVPARQRGGRGHTLVRESRSGTVT